MENTLTLLAAAAAGWCLRHFGILAPRGAAAARGTAAAPRVIVAPGANPLKGEIEQLVQEAVKSAVEAAIADLRVLMTAQPAPAKR